MMFKSLFFLHFLWFGHRSTRCNWETLTSLITAPPGEFLGFPRVTSGFAPGSPSSGTPLKNL